MTLRSYVNFAERLISGLKIVKIGTLMGSFCRKGMTLKFTEELCVMTMKNNAKFEEELTFNFQTDMRNLTNFDSTLWKSKKLLFNLLFNCPRKVSS